MTSSSTYAETVDRYLRFWNTAATGEQHRLASETFADDVQYHAVIGVFTGRQAVIEFHDQFLEHLSTAVFTGREEPQIHHDRGRLRWEIEIDGGQPFAAGTDMLVFDPDGRISSVTTFLDRAPEGFDPHAHD